MIRRRQRIDTLIDAHVSLSRRKDMDAQTAREITRLYRMDLHAQKHFSLGRERGRMHWMIRAWRLQLMARVKIDEVLAAFREEEKQNKKKRSKH
jgi:hypothetical protein